MSSANNQQATKRLKKRKMKTLFIPTFSMTLCGETYWFKSPRDVKLSFLEGSCYSSGRLINLVNTNVIKNLLYFFSCF